MERMVGNQKHDTIISLSREFHGIIHAVGQNRYLDTHIFEPWDLSFETPERLRRFPEYLTHLYLNIQR
jgi:hypothetical protein